LCETSLPWLDDVLDGQRRRVDLVGIALKGSALCVTAHGRFLLHGPNSCTRVVICQAKGVNQPPALQGGRAKTGAPAKGSVHAGGQGGRRDGQD
jgi:hypothetical protein